MSKLSDCVNFLDAKRVPLSSKVRASLAKNYPYYGAQGVVDYVDDWKCQEMCSRETPKI